MPVIPETTRYQDIGIFELCGKMRISDPCYGRDMAGYVAVLDDVKQGEWFALSGVHEGGSPRGWRYGLRIELIALHVSCDVTRLYTDGLAWEELETGIGVDSGQCGIFDDASFADDDLAAGEVLDAPDRAITCLGDFYTLCCDRTINRGASLIPGGVVSTSGEGDGIYRAWVARLAGQAGAVKISFVD